MNSAAGKEMTALWVKMIQEAGPKNWATYTWYQVGTDLGAGASAMIYDADILGYFMNGGDNKEKGNLAFSAFTAEPGGHGTDAQRLDLVAGDGQRVQAEGRRLGVHAVGVGHRARPVRRAADGLRQPGARLGLEGRGASAPGSPSPTRAISSSSTPRRRARRSTSRRSRCSRR